MVECDIFRCMVQFWLCCVCIRAEGANEQVRDRKRIIPSCKRCAHDAQCYDSHLNLCVQDVNKAGRW